MEINHVERFLSGKSYHLDNEGIENMLDQVKEQKGEIIFQKAKEGLIKKETNEMLMGDTQYYYVICHLDDSTEKIKEEVLNDEVREYKLNSQESLTVMDMVQDVIDRGMVCSDYETDKLEEIISYSRDEYEQHRKGVRFEVIVRVIG